jgi:hypothetical protein
MKKNLFIAALAFVAMGANAQVVNTLDGYQAGDQFEKDGVKYELIAVEEGNPVKVVGAEETTLTVQEAFAFEGGDNYTVTDFSAGLAQKDLENITAVPSTPIAIEESFFTEATYKEGYLTIPDGSFKAYNAATGWHNFLAKKSESGIILGELTSDGIVDSDDVAALFDLADNYTMEGEDGYKEEYDMNGDGVIDSDDVAFIYDIAEQYPWY